MAKYECPFQIGDQVELVKKHGGLAADPKWVEGCGPGPYEVIGLFKAPGVDSVDALQVTILQGDGGHFKASNVWFKKVG